MRVRSRKALLTRTAEDLDFRVLPLVEHLPNVDQLARVFVGQGAQQDAVQNAEHGGVGADAQRQRQDRDGGEARALAQNAGGEAHVVDDAPRAATD